MTQLILASGSPRRALLLGMAGFTFATAVPDVDETPLTDEAAADYVLRLSNLKAAAVHRSDDAVVLAADTAVVLDGEIFGKPADTEEALSMLGLLQGRSHTVLTGWTIVADGTERFGVEETAVSLNARSADELKRYVDRTQPFDKAGAYALQGDDGWLVSEVWGSRSNVMGLPIREVVRALEDLGIERSAP